MLGESASNTADPGQLREALWWGRAREAECSGTGDIVSSPAGAPFCPYKAMRRGIPQTSGLLAAAVCPPTPHHCPEVVDEVVAATPCEGTPAPCCRSYHISM